MNVYKIKTGLTKIQIYILGDSLDESDMILLDYLENKVLNMDIVEDNLISSYIICSEVFLESILSIFYKYKVEFKVEDITKLFFYGIVNIDDDDFQKYLVENLNIDTILDKINDLGIESLSDLDKKILGKL
jgi:hypothetical protein